MCDRRNITPPQGDALRKRVEEAFRGKSTRMQGTSEALSLDEIRRLFNELQEYQVELEMQNEDLRRSQGELEATRERYFDLYDLAPVGYFTLSEQEVILEANLAAAGLLGVSRGDLVKQPLARFILPEDQNIYYRHRQQLLATGAPQVCEMRMLRKDAAPFWARIQANRETDPDGAAVCRAVLSDITDQKRAEEALQDLQTGLEDRVRERTRTLAESEERFRMMVEEVKDYAIIMLDAEGRIVSWNAGAERIKGYRADEIVGRHFSQFYPREDMESGKPERALANAIAEGRFEEEGWRVRKDGSLFFAGVIITALRDDAGGLRGFTKITRDITERKQVEREIRQLNADLEGLIVERTAALRIKTRAFDEGITANSIANAEGVIIEANQAFLKMWGCAEMTEVIGKPIGAFLQKSADVERIIAALDGVGTWEGDYTALRKDGSTFTAHGLATALRDVNAGIMGYQSSVIDITEQKRAEQELRERTAALAAFNQVMMGREAHIVELKEEVGRLRAESGKESPAGAPNGEAGEFDSPGSAERRTEEDAPPASSAIPLSEPADMAAPAGKSSRLRWFAALVLLVSLSVTAAVWHAKNREEMKSTQERFDFRVNTFQMALQTRLMDYQSMLRGGAALFDASDEVTRRDWRVYVEAIRIGKEYPGVQGVGFSQRILPAEKEAHLRRIRREGFPGYAVRPEGERPECTSIIFLEPFNERNQRAFGYDMFSEPVRRLAMTRARDTGRPALSGKVTLMQETEKDVQTGFLIYMPVYRPGKALSTPEQRREALAGYVYSPFRMNDFIEGISLKDAREIEVEIHDGKEAQPETLMYRNSVGSLREHDHPHRLTRQTTIEFGGHRWLVTFASSPSFESANMPGRANSILWLGIVISLLLSGMVLFFDRSYRQALALSAMTIEIRKANNQLTAEAARRKRSEEEAQRRLVELTMTHDAMTGRENRLIELKEEVNRLSAEIGREPPYPELWRIAGKETDDPAPAAVEEAPS